MCKSQENEIKHEEASDLRKRSQSRFLGYGDVSQSSVLKNQGVEIKHLEAWDIAFTFLCARESYTLGVLISP